MVAKIAKDYISNAARTNAQIKTALEQLLDILYETPGSISSFGSTITIASDIAQIVDSYATFIVDGEGTAADDLKAISTAGTLRDGQEIEILIADVARPIKLKHNIAGAKKLILLGGADYTIRSVNERVKFKYNLGADAWFQKAPDYTELLKVMLGAKAQAVIAIAASAVTPSSAFIAVNHASANQNLDTIVRTNFPDNGRFILLTAADSAFTYTLRHNQGAAGRILTLDGQSIVLAPGKFVLVEAITSTTDCWREVVRFGYGLPTNPANGDLFVGNGSGGYAVIAGTPSDGMVPTWDNASANKVKWASGAGGSSAVQVRHGKRLTLTSGVPKTTADVLAATTLYNSPTPEGGDIETLWNGTAWVNQSSGGEISLSLSGLAVGVYDIFEYINGGSTAMEALVWTNNTTRATALVRDTTTGILYKTGAKDRKYKGSIRITATGQTEDSTSRCCVFNMYNRRERTFFAKDTTDNWALSSSTFRNFNNSTANGVGQCEFLIGWADQMVEATAQMAFGGSTQAAMGYCGIGIDSSTVNSAILSTPAAVCFANGGAQVQTAGAHYKGYPAVGLHTIAPLEHANGNSVTFYGDNGLATDTQTGLVGSLAA